MLREHSGKMGWKQGKNGAETVEKLWETHEKVT